MSAQWTPISQSDAIKHPLYGVKGWLLLFAIGNFLGPLMNLGRINGITREYGITLGRLFESRSPEIEFIKDALILELLLAAVVLFLLFTKHTNFRNVTSLGRLLFFPFLLVSASLHGLSETGDSLAMTFFPWAISCAVWVTYLQRSERVRVTFENCVRSAVVPNSFPPVSTPVPTDSYDSVAPLHPVVSSAPDKKDIPISPIAPIDTAQDEDSLYTTVAEELGSGNTDKGLWTRLFAECDGDETKTKVQYIKRRFEKLSLAEKLKFEQIELQKLTEIKSDSIPKLQKADTSKEVLVSAPKDKGSSGAQTLNPVESPLANGGRGTEI
jgi:hypothetical protein